MEYRIRWIVFLLVTGMVSAYAAPGKSWSTLTDSFVEKEDIWLKDDSFLADKGKKNDEENRSVFQDTENILIEGDEEGILQAAPPGGNNPQKVPLGKWEISIYFSLFICMLCIYRGRKTNYLHI